MYLKLKSLDFVTWTLSFLSGFPYRHPLLQSSNFLHFIFLLTKIWRPGLMPCAREELKVLVFLSVATLISSKAREPILNMIYGNSVGFSVLTYKVFGTFEPVRALAKTWGQIIVMLRCLPVSFPAFPIPPGFMCALIQAKHNKDNFQRQTSNYISTKSKAKTIIRQQWCFEILAVEFCGAYSPSPLCVWNPL